MTAEEFATYAWLAWDCFYHNNDHWYQLVDHFEQLMAWEEVPREWWEPIRVMAQGECYYSADGWSEMHRTKEARVSDMRAYRACV